MLKEYASRWNYLGLRIKVNGASKLIQFDPKRDGGSYYVTTDKEEIEAIESDKRFNNDYTLFRTEATKEDDATSVNADSADTVVVPLDVLKDPIKASKDGELVEIKVIEDVKNITQAREYLKKIGIDYHKLNTPKAILKQAQDNDIEFPNLKVE